MDDLGNLFNMDPQTANNLMNFGFSTMAASQKPGETTLAALGEGGLGMNQAAQQRAQTQNIQQEGVGKTLNNALTMRQLNLGNLSMGLNPVSMNGVPDLLNQKPSVSTGMTWSQASGSGVGAPSTRTSPSNPIAPNEQNGITQGMLDVAMQKRAPQNRDEAVGAARVANYLGNSAWAKSLTDTSMKGMEPADLRPGGSRIDPLGGTTTVNPAHIQDVGGMTVPFAPEPVTYGEKSPNMRNAGQGLTIPPIPPEPAALDITSAPQGAQPPVRNAGQGIKTGWSPQETETQKNYFGKETESYNGAQKSMQNLELMQHSIDSLNKDKNFLKTGTWGEKRLAIAKSLQSAGVNAVDPNEIASAESLLKTTGRLGFDMSKQLGAREPGVITQQAIKLNPGMENTPAGIQLLKNSVQEEGQRVIDEHNFKGGYYQQNGWNQQKAEAEFDNKYPPALYAKRATSQINPISINNPSGIKQLLAGTKIKTPDGFMGKVKPGIGITPPSYQSVIQPQTPQNQEQPDIE